MDMTLLKEGLIITLLGMGTVFFFLALLIWVMQLTKIVLKFIGKYFPEEILETKTVARKANNSSDEEIALAIAYALKHRSS